MQDNHTEANPGHVIGHEVRGVAGRAVVVQPPTVFDRAPLACDFSHEIFLRTSRKYAAFTACPSSAVHILVVWEGREGVQTAVCPPPLPGYP